MTLDDRNALVEAADILQYLGGNNGVTNLRPKIKHQLIRSAAKLKKVVENDISASKAAEAREQEKASPGIPASRDELELMNVLQE